MEAFGSRRIGPARMLLTATPRAAAVTLRERLSQPGRRGGRNATPARAGGSVVGAPAGSERESGNVPV